MPFSHLYKICALRSVLCFWPRWWDHPDVEPVIRWHHDHRHNVRIFSPLLRCLTSLLISLCTGRRMDFKPFVTYLSCASRSQFASVTMELLVRNSGSKLHTQIQLAHRFLVRCGCGSDVYIPPDKTFRCLCIFAWQVIAKQ
jgi:hypothetical protein